MPGIRVEDTIMMTKDRTMTDTTGVELKRAMPADVDAAAGAGDGDNAPAMVRRDLTPAARRALDEARARRKAKLKAQVPKEIDGREGLEPTRYGDWERNGLISDF